MRIGASAAGLSLTLVGGCTPDEERPGCPAAPEFWDPVLEPWTIATEADGFRFADGTTPTADGLGFEGDGEMAHDLTATRGVAYRIRASATSGGAASLFVEWLADTGATDRLAQADLSAAVDLSVMPITPGRQLVIRIVGAGGVHVDSLAVDYEEWAAVTDTGGGVLRIGFVVHVEDVPEVKNDETEWRRQARVFEGLIETLAAHEGRVTVQADSTFVVGAELWDAGWPERMEALGAGWSAHLHDEDQGVEGLEQAARAARHSWREVAVDVQDVNGGFQLAAWELLASTGFTSLTAYKDPATQDGLPVGAVLPWRPPDGAGTADATGFLTHDPEGPLVYLPGAMEREAAHARFPEVASRRLSQMLAHTRAGEVNTAYVLSHVDLFGPTGDDGDALDAYLDGGGFAADLEWYDAWLSSTVDPLVDTGRVEWRVTAEMAEEWMRRDYKCEP